MRLTFLALFLCSGVTALCQSTAPAPAKPEKSVENPSNNQTLSDNMKLSRELSIPSFAPVTEKHRFNLPTTWSWDNAQSSPKKISPSPFLNSEIVTLHIDGAQWPNLKREPIPTQWSNLTVQQIPTDWPNLKMVLIASQLNPPAVVQATLK
jgi:hypothetical protein